MALTHLEKKQISKRYARAAYELAAARGDAEQALEALQALASLIAGSDVLKQSIRSPLLPKDALAESFAAILAKFKAPKSALDLVSLAIRNGRASILPLLADSFQAQLDAAAGVVRGEIVSASELDRVTIEQIAADLSTKGRKVALSARTDASLIGGIRIYLGSQMIDASVAGQLSRLKQQLTKPALREANA